MKPNEVFDVEVEDVVSLDNEDKIIDFVVVHVYSRGVGASDVVHVGLVLDVDAGLDVVADAEAVT